MSSVADAPKLLDRVRHAIRTRHYSRRTEEAYVHCTFEPHTFLAEGDKVVVLGFERVRSRRTGRSYENHWVHAFTLAHGKIVKFREYCDTATVAAAFRQG
jgi:ketosteroid isomerase-like protein